MQQTLESTNQLHLIIDESILSKITTIIISTYGPPSIYSECLFKKSSNIGTLQASNQIIANLLVQDHILIINYIKDIRYYFYEQYNLKILLQAKGLKSTHKFIILSNVPASSLDNYSSQDSQLRLLQKNSQEKTTIKQLEQTNFEGYFDELYSDLTEQSVVAILLIQTDYDLTPELISLYDKAVKQFVQIKEEFYIVQAKEAIKIHNKKAQRDHVYL